MKRKHWVTPTTARKYIKHYGGYTTIGQNFWIKLYSRNGYFIAWVSS